MSKSIPEACTWTTQGQEYLGSSAQQHSKSHLPNERGVQQIQMWFADSRARPRID